MIQNENFSVYDSPSYLPESSSYSIISLSECQGFIFNQDLFALPYQQVRSQANERKVRALSFSKGKNSRNSSFLSVSPPSQIVCSTSSSLLKERRHTSYHSPRPIFRTQADDEIDIAIEDEEEVEEDEDIEEDEDEQMHDAQEANSDSDEQDDGYDESEEDEYEDMHYSGSGNTRYKVHVTEIVIDEKDCDIFPS